LAVCRDAECRAALSATAELLVVLGYDATPHSNSNDDDNDDDDDNNCRSYQCSSKS